MSSVQVADRLEASLRQAMTAFESGDLRRAGVMITAERRRAASTGDDEAIEIIDTWVPQLRAALDDDREVGDVRRRAASDEACGGGAQKPATPEPEAPGGAQAESGRRERPSSRATEERSRVARRPGREVTPGR